jgi:surface polysaccharide O-acyltransferase-like enzyme
MKSQSVLDPAALPAPQTSPIANRNSSPSPSREYGLDWLRVFAFSVLILYHTGMIFVSWDFHIKNAETSKGLEWAMLLANRWRLPLLFLISGAAVFFSLRTRSYGAFVQERLRRLLIPVAFGMLVIVPPQIYFERLQQGARLTYLEWYPTVFDFQPYPQGSFSWHHLWFVVYILVYSLLGIPFFQWVRSEHGRRAVAAMVRAFERWPWTLYLINLPNLVAGLTLGPHWPTTHNLVADWANFTGCFLTFLWGVTIASNRRFLDIATERRREFLIAGLAIAAAFFTLRATGWLGLTGTPRMLVAELLSAYFGMTWVLFLIGYARHWFRHGGPKLRYANEAVYPFYIVHQTVTIAVGYYVLQQPWGIWPKFAVVAVATFLGSWLCFEIVRRTALTRLLFGLKP